MVMQPNCKHIGRRLKARTADEIGRRDLNRRPEICSWLHYHSTAFVLENLSPHSLNPSSPSSCTWNCERKRTPTQTFTCIGRGEGVGWGVWRGGGLDPGGGGAPPSIFSVLMRDWIAPAVPSQMMMLLLCLPSPALCSCTRASNVSGFSHALFTLPFAFSANPITVKPWRVSYTMEGGRDRGRL